MGVLQAHAARVLGGRRLAAGESVDRGMRNWHEGLVDGGVRDWQQGGTCLVGIMP